MSLDCGDEMDMMKEKVANADQVEEKFSHLQDKLKEMAELRKQYKALQEQSNTYMQRSIELEDEVVKIPLLKAQIEDYKKQGTRDYIFCFCIFLY
jgi:uracil phosphoribosyltransferase